MICPYYNLNYKFSLRQALAACHQSPGVGTGEFRKLPALFAKGPVFFLMSSLGPTPKAYAATNISNVNAD